MLPSTVGDQIRLWEQGGQKMSVSPSPLLLVFFLFLSTHASSRESLLPIRFCPCRRRVFIVAEEVWLAWFLCSFVQSNPRGALIICLLGVVQRVYQEKGGVGVSLGEVLNRNTNKSYSRVVCQVFGGGSGRLALVQSRIRGAHFRGGQGQGTGDVK